MSRAMKDSGIPWIGEIPEGWSVENIGAGLKEINSPNRNCIEDNALQFKMGTIISKKFGNSKYNPETLEGYNQVKKGDIIINGLNLSFDFISKRIGLVQENGAITSTYLAVRPQKHLNSRFTTYLLKSYDACKVLHGMGKGLRQTLTYGEFKKYKIFFPPFSEQQKIADYLDRKCSEIDKMIALEEKVIEELKAYKQSVITEAVTKGLNPDVPMKDSGIEWIGEIPEVWSVLPFKACYRMFKGLNITKDNLTSTGHPVISYGQIHSKQNIGTGINCNLLKFISEDYLSKNPNCLSKEFDLFLADTSEDREGVGNAVFIDTEKPIFAGYHTIIARPLTVTKSKYFAYQLQTDAWRFQLRKEVSGIKVFTISQKLLNKTFIIIPTSKEQKAIADYLDHKCSEIDSLINIKLSKIDSLKDYKKSIIYEYVTGKREVQ